MSEEIQTASMEVPVAGTDKTIAVSRPDQGSRVIQLAMDRPNMAVHIWEGEQGDDLDGFRARWRAFVDGQEPDMWYLDARFGEVAYLERGIIPHVIGFSVQYHRREDVRAPMALLAFAPQPGGLPILRRG